MVCGWQLQLPLLPVTKLQETGGVEPAADEVATAVLAASAFNAAKRTTDCPPFPFSIGVQGDVFSWFFALTVAAATAQFKNKSLQAQMCIEEIPAGSLMITYLAGQRQCQSCSVAELLSPGGSRSLGFPAQAAAPPAAAASVAAAAAAGVVDV